MVVKNKKAAELTIGTIIIIVLGVAVLVFLIWGFGTGWSNLWGKITSYTGGGSNVDTTRQACDLACSGSQTGEYCDNVRTVTLSDKKVVRGTCNSLSGVLKSTSGCTLTCTGALVSCPEASWSNVACPTETTADITSTITDSGNHDVTKEKCCSPKNELPRCVDQAGTVNAAKAGICPKGKCPQGNLVVGSYSDVSNVQECCKSTCNM